MAPFSFLPPNLWLFLRGTLTLEERSKIEATAERKSQMFLSEKQLDPGTTCSPAKGSFTGVNIAATPLRELSHLSF